MPSINSRYEAWRVRPGQSKHTLFHQDSKTVSLSLFLSGHNSIRYNVIGTYTDIRAYSKCLGDNRLLRKGRTFVIDRQERERNSNHDGPVIVVTSLDRLDRFVFPGFPVDTMFLHKPLIITYRCMTSFMSLLHFQFCAQIDADARRSMIRTPRRFRICSILQYEL